MSVSLSAIEQRLRELEDREAIRRVLTDYGRMLDGKDPAGFAALFAEDGEWKAAAHQAQGRAAIQAMIERLVASGPPEGQSHLLTNFVIELDGDRATAASRFYVVAPAEDGAPRVRLSGRYDDELTREEGHWKIQRRLLTQELRLPDGLSAEPARIRRVITGHDDAGRSIVTSDAPTTMHAQVGARGMTIHDIWETHVVPALIEATEPDPTAIPLQFTIPKAGVRVRIADIPPAGASEEPFMHRTEAIDYVVVLEGEIIMLMEDEADTVVLRKGDTLVQRGTNHAWVNRSSKPCRLLFIIVAARLSEGLKQTIGIEEVTWDAQGGGVR